MPRPLRRVPLVVAGVFVSLLAGAPVLFAGAPSVSATVTPGVRPDIVLSPEHRSYQKQVDSILVNDPSPLAHDEVEDVNPPSPDQCRQLPALDLLCDVYRIRIVKDPAPGAANFVQILLSWPKQASTPALPLAAVGVGDADLPDIDVFLYANSDSPMDYAQVGGRGTLTPERIVFEATQQDYDLVVRSGTGVVVSYTLAARVSNELPIKPFELLEEVTPPNGAGAANAPDEPVAAPGVVGLPTPPLALAPIGADDQIANIGLGATERFDADSLGAITNTRTPSATAGAPSGFTLVLAMVLFPVVVAGTAAWFMRRRRDAVLS